MIFASLLIMALTPTKNPPLPPIVRDFRGVWVATVDNIDWPSKRGEPVDVAKAELQEIVNKVSNLHMNCIVFQVRPSADALYDSPYEPWSEYLTGRQGVTPKPAWDPLSYLIHAAHLKGIQVQAWFNPYRARSSAQHGPNASSSISNTHPDVVYSYGGNLWMDPGSKYVQNETLKVILDVVKRYDLDGIHLDDYFYPYPVNGKDGKSIPFPDSRTFDAYRDEGGKLDLGDWRRRNVNSLIERIHEGVHQIKPWVLFNVSPFGIYRPGVPKGIQAGVDQYAELYADPLKWLQSGWIDAISPQLYWPIKQKPQSFKTLLDWWGQINTLKRHLWPGIYTDRVRMGSYSVKEVIDEIKLVSRGEGKEETQFSEMVPNSPRIDGKGDGTVHFSYKVLQENAKGINQALLNGPYSQRALVPASPWNAVGKAPVVKVRLVRKDGEVSAELSGSKGVGLFGYTQILPNGNWSKWEFLGGNRIKLQGGAAAFVAIDRYGRVSKAVELNLN